MARWRLTTRRALLVAFLPVALASCFLFEEFAPLAPDPLVDASDEKPPSGDGGSDGSDAADSGPRYAGDLTFVKVWPCFAGSLAVHEDDTFIAGRCDGPDGAVIVDDAGIDAGSEDVGLVRFDREGIVRWTNALGSSGSENPSAVAAGESSLYLTGLYNSPSLQIASDVLSFNPATQRAAFVAKLSADGGAPSWGRSVVADQVPAVLCSGIAVSGDGVVVGCGVKSGTVSVAGAPILTGAGNSGDEDAVVASLRGDGTLKWWNVFRGTGDDRITKIAAYKNGDVLIAINVASKRLSDTKGTVDAPKPGDPADSIPFIARLGTDGTVLWSKYLGSGHASVSSIAISPDDSTIAVGMTIYEETRFDPSSPTLGPLKPSGFGDAVLLVLDATPAVKWQARIGGSNATEPDDADDVAFDLAGNVAVVGKNRSPDMRVGTVVLRAPPQETSTGGSGGWAAFVAKFSPTGDLRWAKGFASSNYDDAVGMHRVAFTKNGDMRVSGGLQGIAVLDGDGGKPYEAGVELYRQVLWGFGP